MGRTSGLFAWSAIWVCLVVQFGAGVAATSPPLPESDQKVSTSHEGNGMSSSNGNPIQTTDAGIPVESDKYSLTVGAGGPILLQDSYLIEQMANFNRERITERQPHAKGSGAFGRIEITNDVSAFTKAALFQPGTTTRLLSRFSTVAGERGSPDMWRDLRGFSLKFYTSEGNYDMVGNEGCTTTPP